MAGDITCHKNDKNMANYIARYIISGDGHCHKWETLKEGTNKRRLLTALRLHAKSIVDTLECGQVDYALHQTTICGKGYYTVEARCMYRSCKTHTIKNENTSMSGYRFEIEDGKQVMYYKGKRLG